MNVWRLWKFILIYPSRARARNADIGDNLHNLHSLSAAPGGNDGGRFFHGSLNCASDERGKPLVTCFYSSSFLCFEVHSFAAQ